MLYKFKKLDRLAARLECTDDNTGSSWWSKDVQGSEFESYKMFLKQVWGKYVRGWKRTMLTNKQFKDFLLRKIGPKKFKLHSTNTEIQLAGGSSHMQIWLKC